jgi:hypothetical protein
VGVHLLFWALPHVTNLVIDLVVGVAVAAEFMDALL